MTEEYDSSKKAWEFYRTVYSSRHWITVDEFDMVNVCTWHVRNSKQNPTNTSLRYLAYIKPESILIKKLGKEFSLSGECIYNFNDKKFDAFMKIINKEKDYCKAEKMKQKLMQCNKMHHEEDNLSLMPTTGAMNIFKGKVFFGGDGFISLPDGKWHMSAYDRFDTFMVCLDDFYNNRNEYVLSCATECNYMPLKHFLKLFNNVYEYCEVFYFIKNRTYVDELIQNGKKTLTQIDELDRYMELAIDYWHNQRKIPEK